MRDRWVALYLVLVLAQLPLYWWLGEGPLGFETAAREVETLIRDSLGRPEEREKLERSIKQAYARLERMGDQTSRRGRMKLNEGTMEWKFGKTDRAIEALQESYQVFVEKHGNRSFHAAVVEARLGELYFVQRRYPEALLSLERSLGPIRDFLGPRDPLVVRLAFRRVSILASLEKMAEAQQLAQQYLGALKSVASEQDSFFLQSVGGTLDLLVASGHFHHPPIPFGNWKSYLGSLKPVGGDGVKVKSSPSF